MPSVNETGRPFERVLIANRGEIAIRVAKAATGLGMETVGVYVPADAQALHTAFVTKAVELRGGQNGSPVAGYLDAEALVQAAVDNGCDAIHPGYGFLSESAAFATLCAQKGITFVGPSAEVLSLFGDKIRARSFAESAGIPVVPGSHEAMRSADQARERAQELGFPVVLKAAAGGGGRGMRMLKSAEEISEAFERCRGEAEAAFGDGTLMLEKRIERPRHIEVQVLGDSRGTIVHLWERDCSVQLRNQKVVEIAPAPEFDSAVRERVLADAVRLAEAAGYMNAGTLEFLVEPETGRHYFIEANPRIQVEHTVTEEVTGVDLVEAQFRVASGEPLSAVGLSSQTEVPQPRGFAVQARVVAEGPGSLTAYKEPAGPGVRVDACGYLGLTPPPDFDPLLAKVIGSSNSSRSFVSAVDRTLRALDEFHIDGLPVNLSRLRAILSHPDFRAGNARTSFLDEHPDLDATAPSAGIGPLALLGERAAAVTGNGGAALAPANVGLQVAPGLRGVTAPLTGSVVSCAVSPGERVAEGDTLLVLSAMKMESLVTAPCAGTVSELLSLSPGDTVETGMVVATITPGEGAAPTATPGKELPREQTWGPMLDEVRAFQRIAEERLAPGSNEPGVLRQRSRGKLDCRERIALVLDDGSFREVGSGAGFISYDDEGSVADFTPANHVGGWGTVEGRKTIVCADDFTSRGGHADGSISEKSRYLDRLSLELRVPSVRLLDGSSGGGSVAAMVPSQSGEKKSTAQESTGATTAGRPRVTGTGGSFLPGHLGSTLYAEQLATVPVVNMLLGSVVGIGAAKAVLGHFSVMVRDISQLFVAGPPVVSHAMGYDITKEDLGDWRIHCRNGSVDNLAETEEEAAEMTRRFLSYLPPSVYEAPPVVPASDRADRREAELFTIIPRKRTTTFDIRRAIRLMADQGSFFEVGPYWGTDQVTGFARFNGYPVGVIASDSQHPNGGALTADGCSKLTRHLDLCDLFHLPVVNLVDNPGFAVGKEHEMTSTIRRGGEWMVAFAQTTVPIFTVLMRRSFGVAGNNYATPRAAPSVRVAWPSADVGGIPPEGGIEAAYKRQLEEAEDPAALRAEIDARIESARGPLGPISRFQIEEIIDPRDTRPYVCEWVEDAYRIASGPGRLGPRPLGFRP